MAQDGLQADITALRNFAQEVGSTSGATGSGGGSGGSLAATVQGLPNKYQVINTINFGQFASDGTTYTGFTDALNLYHVYLGLHQDLVANPNSSLNTFVSQLNAIADVAATVAQRYQDAQTEDAVGPTDMSNLLNNPPSPTQPA